VEGRRVIGGDAKELELAGRKADLVVIGGGIHGAQVALEGARRGLSTVLLEAQDFGAGASSNSLRIVHGGLRYLQSGDLGRFSHSVRERRWFARHYPHLVRPLPCLMPLYGKGVRRAAVMRVALTANDFLSSNRNDGVPADAALPASCVLSSAQTRMRWPGVPNAAHLEAGALWHDYWMLSSERILIETLHQAAAHGASILNRARVTAVNTTQGKVSGVEFTAAGSNVQLRSGLVANCTGAGLQRVPGCENSPASIFHPSLAFNLVLDRPLGSDCALAVSADPGKGTVLFIVPQGRSCVAGTVHGARPAGTVKAEATAAEIAAFLQQLNAALPGLDAGPEHVRRVLQGLLPVATEGSTALTSRELVFDHRKSGGPHGLVSVAGIKFTTSHAVAVQTVELMAQLAGRQLGHAAALRQLSAVAADKSVLTDAGRFLQLSETEATALIASLVAEEGAASVSDIMERRSNWSMTHGDQNELTARIESCLASMGLRENELEVSACE
jgi:glycerol-3-phosphate dehydrogenase